MKERPRDEKGRFIAYAECKKAKCKQEHKENALLRQKVTFLNKEVKQGNKIITPLSIFLGVIVLLLLIVLAFSRV